MSKGSKRRPQQISEKEMIERWEKAFGNSYRAEDKAVEVNMPTSTDLTDEKVNFLEKMER